MATNCIGIYCTQEIRKQKSIIKKDGTLNTEIVLRHLILIEEITHLSTVSTHKNTIAIHTEEKGVFYFNSSLRFIINQVPSFISISKSIVINSSKINSSNNTFSVVYVGQHKLKFKVSRVHITKLTAVLNKQYIL